MVITGNCAWRLIVNGVSVFLNEVNDARGIGLRATEFVVAEPPPPVDVPPLALLVVLLRVLEEVEEVLRADVLLFVDDICRTVLLLFVPEIEPV